MAWRPLPLSMPCAEAHTTKHCSHLQARQAAFKPRHNQTDLRSAACRSPRAGGVRAAVQRSGPETFTRYDPVGDCDVSLHATELVPPHGPSTSCVGVARIFASLSAKICTRVARAANRSQSAAIV